MTGQPGQELLRLERREQQRAVDYRDRRDDDGAEGRDGALPEVAEARGVSTRRMELCFLVVMALATRTHWS